MDLDLLERFSLDSPAEIDQIIKFTVQLLEKVINKCIS
jgi:hypothetical protein